jgi:hypothetical protein
LTAPSSPYFASNVGGVVSFVGGTFYLNWYAPSSNGGAAITGYDVSLMNSSGVIVGKTSTAANMRNASFANLPVGLYYASVTAKNSVGKSSPAVYGVRITLPSPQKSISFSDVSPSSVFATDISWAYMYRITTGTTSTTFSPSSTVTRAQMAAFIYRLAGSPTWNQSSCGFKDVSSSNQFAKPICWMKAKGITSGVTATQYAPNGSVTRAQMAAFLYRLAGSPSWNQSSCGFKDVSSSNQFAKPICWMRDTGITTGTSATTYSPNTAVPRQQMVAFLHRMYSSVM